jgi:hypothetical protein
MDNHKALTTFLVIVIVALLLLLIFGHKKEIYVCYDGTQQEVATKCPSVPPLTITQKAADTAITTYANSYARSKPGVTASVVNVYRVNTSWHSDVTFSNSRTGEFNELTFNIDGKTASITCIKGCEYLAAENVEPAVQ